MRIIDVSLKIDEETATYPGNPRPEIEKYRQKPSDSTTESEIRIGSHTGTHIDAPQHVREGGETAAELDLENFYGAARVLDLVHCTEKVDRADLEDLDFEEEIVLLKTENSRQGYDEFREDFTYLTLEAVEYLIDEGVRTVGIDYLSLVDFEDTEESTKAHEKANEEMNVVEGLDLSDAEPGSYTFSAMPLKIDVDGAPARAVLIDRQS